MSEMTQVIPGAPDSLLQRARDVVETEIRPLIQGDGGDIEVVALGEDGILKVRMHGACVNCASQSVTLALGIEPRLREFLPEIKGIDQV